jgi:hypothetical protein
MPEYELRVVFEAENDEEARDETDEAMGRFNSIVHAHLQSDETGLEANV